MSATQQVLTLTESLTGIKLDEDDDKKVELQIQVLDHSQRWIREGTETNNYKLTTKFEFDTGEGPKDVLEEKRISFGVQDMELRRAKDLRVY